MKSRGRRDGRTRRPTTQPRPSPAVPSPGHEGTPEPGEESAGPGPAATAVAATAVATTAAGTTTLPQPDDSGIDAWVSRLFVPAALLILLVAAAFRLPELALNPFHHDEGVNGWFTTNLVRSGTYVYDPANYHGPTLYYFALASEILFGLTTEAMRLVPVFFGLLTVAGVLALRPVLGSIPALVAAALLAVSPGSVYVSRYFIHEALLVAFSLGLVLALLLYLRSGKPAWALTAAASAAFIFTTKETGIITVVVLAIAAVVSVVYVNLRTGRPAFEWRRSPWSRGATPGSRVKRPAKSIWVDGIEYRAAPESQPQTDEPRSTEPGWLGSRRPTGELLAAAAIVFACVYVLFFSSFFTNFPKGLVDSLATFTIWTQTSAETQVQPFQQYLVWMAGADGPILLLGAMGGLIAAIRGRDRLWVFIGLWAAGVTLAYSLVSYKTPWIIVNMLLPLALLAGHAIRRLVSERDVLRVAATVLVAGALAWSSYQAYDLNYRHYDDETYPYVFVHTTREALDLVAEIEATGQRLGTGRETGITIVSRDYWPLPWYLRDYPKAAFFGSIVDTEEAMILADVTQQAELAPAIQGRYESVGTYQLRPGVELELYLRSDAAVAAP